MGETPMSSGESHPRSIVKALSWRATGTLDTFVLSYLITGNLVFAGSIAGIETMTKMVLYYCHERIWAAIAWGRWQPDAPPTTTGRPLVVRVRTGFDAALRLWMRTRYP